MLAVLVVAAALACAGAYPAPRAYYPAYPYMDAVSMGGGGGDGATVLSRYYQPYQYQQQPYWSGAAFMYGAGAGGDQRAERLSPQQRYPQKSPEQNELTPPPAPPVPPTPELEEVTESAPRVTALLVTEQEDEEATQRAPTAPARRIHGKKRVLKPSYEDEVEDEEAYAPPPAAAYFPMYFGYGGRRGGGGEGGSGGGVTAIANAYSTGRGGVATSHATAYGPRPGSHR